MAASYEWDVSNVDYYPQYDGHNKVIFKVHWRLKGIDSEVDAQGNPYSAEVYGSENLNVSDLSNFVDYDSVTISDVQGWVESALGAEQVQKYKDDIEAQISELKNPSVQHGVISS
jgi:hypothetical protein